MLLVLELLRWAEIEKPSQTNTMHQIAMYQTASTCQVCTRTGLHQVGLHGRVKFLCYTKHFHWFQRLINCPSDAKRVIALILTSVGNAKAGSRTAGDCTGWGRKRRSDQCFPLGSSASWDGQSGTYLMGYQGKGNYTSLSIPPKQTP